MLDVTSWKIIFKDKFKKEYKKKNQHRALDDVRESIEEMKHYLQFVKFENL
jgi:oligoribonuclease